MYNCGFDQIAAGNLICNSLSCAPLIRLFMTGEHLSISTSWWTPCVRNLSQPTLLVAEAALGGVAKALW
jgi:hypothetical protein